MSEFRRLRKQAVGQSKEKKGKWIDRGCSLTSRWEKEERGCREIGKDLGRSCHSSGLMEFLPKRVQP